MSFAATRRVLVALTLGLALASCTKNMKARPAAGQQPAGGASTGSPSGTQPPGGGPAGSGGPTSAAVLVESRGVWFTLNELLEGKDKLLARLDRLKAARFNTIYVDVQMRGYVIYPGSQVLPQLPEAKEKAPDLLDWLIPAIHERGMRVEAWPEYGFYAHWTPDAAKAPDDHGHWLNAHPELASTDSTGAKYLHNEKWGDYYLLCPSNPGSHDLLLSLYKEVMAKYAFDGLNLDRVRYATGDHCHCPYCQEKFLKDTGIPLAAFPPDSPEAEALRRWRKKQLVGFLARVSEEIRKEHPGKPITSAVVPPDTIDEKGQDWPEWLTAGYLDAAMPMLYSPDLGPSLRRIERMVPRSARIFTGLDASLGIKTLESQIAQARASGAAGITIWYGKTLDPVMEPLAKGAFKPEAASPLYPR